MINKKVTTNLLYELNNLHHVVVQASLVEDNQIFALQLLHKQTDIAVFKADKSGLNVDFNINNSSVYLSEMAGGHTQTFIPAGKPGYYFIGTKPKKHGSILWDTQIARINLNDENFVEADSNTELVRLSYLNRAGSGFANNEIVYPGKHLVRLEAGVSPDLTKFMIASIDDKHTGHFALYNLTDINQALDQAEETHEDVNIENIPAIGAFTIDNFNVDLIPSVQGYAIDNNANIYVSCQLSPRTNFFGLAKNSKPRQIVKIPWGETNSENWICTNLDQDRNLDAFGYATEFEGIQPLANGDLYLTVAYHEKNGMTTLKNRVYEISGL